MPVSIFPGSVSEHDLMVVWIGDGRSAIENSLLSNDPPQEQSHDRHESRVFLAIPRESCTLHKVLFSRPVPHPSSLTLPSDGDSRNSRLSTSVAG